MVKSCCVIFVVIWGGGERKRGERRGGERRGGRRVSRLRRGKKVEQGEKQNGTSLAFCCSHL